VIPEAQYGPAKELRNAIHLVVMFPVREREKLEQELVAAGRLDREQDVPSFDPGRLRDTRSSRCSALSSWLRPSSARWSSSTRRGDPLVVSKPDAADQVALEREGLLLVPAPRT